VTVARRHPVSIALALAAGVVLGLAGALGDWSTGVVYLAALALIVVFGAGAVGLEQRRKGRGRPGASPRPAARGRY